MRLPWRRANKTIQMSNNNQPKKDNPNPVKKPITEEEAKKLLAEKKALTNGNQTVQK